MNTPPPSILLTGATGFIGSHFLPTWLEQNTDGRVFALARAEDPGKARARVATALARSAAAYDRGIDVEALMERVTALPGDLAREDLGLDVRDEERLAGAGISEVWHFAADPGTGDEGRAAEENVAGAERLHALACRIGARRFVLVSSADVSNARAGVERRLLDLAGEGGPDLAIVRPASVLGSSITKTSGRTPYGLYGLIRRLASVRDALRDAGKPVRFQVRAEGAIDFIPVDGLVAGMVALAADGFPGGPIHHFAGGAPIDLRTVLEMIADRMRIPGLEPVEEHPLDETALERNLSWETGRFRDCVRDRSETLSARPGLLAVSEVDLLNYVEAGVRDALYGTAFDLFERQVFRSCDGSELTVYTAGAPDHPALVCCNAYGVPPEVFVPLVHDMRDRRRIVLWDTRGLPSLTPSLEDDQLSIDAHVGDLFAIMDAFGIERADLAGWSTGAVVAAKAAADRPERIRSLALLNGGFVLPGAAEVPFQTATRNIMPKMAVSLKSCEILYNIIFGNRQDAPFRWEERQIEKDGNDFVGAIYKGYMHMARFLARDVESCFRYARIVRSHLAKVEEAVSWLPKVKAPTFVLTCSGDITAHPEGSIEAAKLVPDATLYVHDRGDHFLFYSEDEARRRVCDFLDRQDRPAVPGRSEPALS